MTNQKDDDGKDRMTIFPEDRSGEAGKEAQAAGRSKKRDEKQVKPIGGEGQDRAKDFRDDQDRQMLGGKMDRDR